MACFVAARAPADGGADDVWQRLSLTFHHPRLRPWDPWPMKINMDAGIGPSKPDGKREWGGFRACCLSTTIFRSTPPLSTLASTKSRRWVESTGRGMAHLHRSDLQISSSQALSLVSMAVTDRASVDARVQPEQDGVRGGLLRQMLDVRRSKKCSTNAPQGSRAFCRSTPYPPSFQALSLEPAGARPGSSVGRPSRHADTHHRS
ncbi:hypothetical protein NXC14_CH01197 [Rhizobium sp. NXC14]|nr:hypothetical protein NXC14_CH01197 [Rhizobium sp. NXC14]